MWKHQVKNISIFIFYLTLIVGCTQKTVNHPKKYPIKVGVATVEDVPQFIKGIGKLIPALEVNLKAQVSGILTNVLFTDGQLVEEGDLLMTIDPRIYEAQVEQAVAQLNENRARLRYSLDFAETYGTLVSKDYVSRLDYEQAIQNVDIYKSAIEEALAAIKKAQVDLGYTQIRAPFKGYLGLRKYDPGNYVDSSIGNILVTLKKITPLSVKFYLPAEYVQEIRQKQQISPLYLEAELPNDPAYPLTGSLWFIDNNVNPDTGMITLEGTIPNEDERGWPGQFVRVYLRLKTFIDAVLVPKQAVVLGELGNFVFVLDEQKMQVKMRMIGKGFVYKDAYVVLWGLKGGETIVTDGQLNLTENAYVYIP